VRHHGGSFGEGLDSTETFGEGENLEGLEELGGLLDAALDVEGDHGSWSSLLLLCDSVLWVALKAWVDDLSHLLVGVQSICHGNGVLLSSLESDLKGLGASEGQPRVECWHASAHSLHHKEQTVVKLSVVEDQSSANDVRVASNVLSNRVGHNVGAEVKWVSVDGRGESVVDDEKSVRAFHGLGDGFDVEDLEGGVGWGFEPDELDIWLQIFLELLDVREVGEGNLDLGVWSEDLSQVSLGAAVHVVDAQESVTWLHKVHDSNMSSHA